MINFKQEELIEEMIRHVQEKFPEIRLVEISESPEDPQDLWVRVTAPEDEDRKLELISFACEKSMDILLEYGYHILIMPTAASQPA
jgi:hypothetical protein